MSSLPQTDLFPVSPSIADTPELDLNVSREMLQHNPAVLKIGKSVVKRILSELGKKKKKDIEAYQQFWQQLTMANFASGIETGSNSFGHGRSHPAAPIGGGFSAVFSRGAGVASPSALWLRLHNSLLDANPEVGARITPYQGAIIDRKIDDGLPGTGIVQAFQDGNPSPGDPDNCEHEYDEKSNRAHCMLTFRITN